MSGFLEQAKEKLTVTSKASLGVYESAMLPAVRNALISFCEQDEEFAQAVAQGGDFADCMKAVAHGVGSSISDIEAYRKAVQFYFPGADIHMNMSIDLCASVGGGETKPAGGILVSLDSFF